MWILQLLILAFVLKICVFKTKNSIRVFWSGLFLKLTSFFFFNQKPTWKIWTSGENCYLLSEIGLRNSNLIENSDLGSVYITLKIWTWGVYFFLKESKTCWKILLYSFEVEVKLASLPSRTKIWLKNLIWAAPFKLRHEHQLRLSLFNPNSNLHKNPIWAHLRFEQTWISEAWKNSGHFTWTSTQNLLQGAGILQAQFAALYVWYTHWCSICGSWFLCHFWGMGWVGTVISLLREMFLQHLGTHFGPCFVISRCLDSCLLGRWIERWRGLVKGLFCKHIDDHSYYLFGSHPLFFFQTFVVVYLYLSYILPFSYKLWYFR